jgi:hypothetical protein
LTTQETNEFFLSEPSIYFTPETQAELLHCLKFPNWRLNNLYKITVKDEEDTEGKESKVVTFRMNEAQKRLAEGLWYRNIIPKARQLGFTTFSCILALDYCLFNDNFQSVIQADTEGKARKIMNDKVKFAYDRLPGFLRAQRPKAKDSEEEIRFSNGSSIHVTVSARGGTTDFLHISEYGAICARNPGRAAEVVTGSLPSVPLKGIVIIESTAEGRDGDFYDRTMIAKKNHDAGKKLTVQEYRLHFYPWFESPDYQMDPRGVIITEKDHEYFDEIELENNVSLSMRQRAWYVSYRENVMSGSEEKMWQEMPSSVDEAFKVSNEGVFYKKQMAAARKKNRIVPSLPHIPSIPCMTFWDIGRSDGTAIWVFQKVGMEFRAINFFEGWDEPYSFYVNWLQETGYNWGKMYLPHDADHKRQGQIDNKSPKEMLEDLMPGVKFEVVPRIEHLSWGIQQTRDAFPLFYFDETNCKEGINHLDLYHKKWNARQERWNPSEAEKSDGHSEAADALRQLGQSIASGVIVTTTDHVKKKTSNRRRGWGVV